MDLESYKIKTGRISKLVDLLYVGSVSPFNYYLEA